jgi:drug/metabolite transporter (DMT)-like permease
VWTPARASKDGHGPVDIEGVFALSLAFGASVAWGSADFLAGVGCRRLALLTVMLVSQAIGLVLLIPVMVATASELPSNHYVVMGVLAGAFNAAALAAFYRGLAGGTMGIVAPIAATDAVIPVGYGLITGERPTPITMIGIALALIGVVMASRPSKTHEEEPDESDRKRDSAAKGVALALVAAVCFGMFTICLADASHGGTLWAVTFSRLMSLYLLSCIAVIVWPELSVKRGDAVPLIAIGGLDVTANALFALALSAGLLSVVGVLGSFYPVVTIILAGIVLREKLGPTQRLGAASALAGAAAMALG